MQVAALENGTVIDHIPNEKLFEVVRLLHLEEIRDSSILMGYNLDSTEMGQKSLIKVSNHFFSDAELNQLAVLAPNVSLSIIKNSEIVEKKTVCLPSTLKGIVRCPNPKCITNNEPMDTIFYADSEQTDHLTCHYCEHKVKLDEVEFK